MDDFVDRIIIFLAILPPLIDRHPFSSNLFTEVVALAIYFRIWLEMYNEVHVCRWTDSSLNT